MRAIHSSIKVLVHLIHQYFIWLIVASYVLAATFPALGLWIRQVNLGSWAVFDHQITLSTPLLMLAVVLFNAGLGVNLKELRALLRHPFDLLGGLFGNVTTPLVFLISVSVVMQTWHNPIEVQQILVGLALVASMPIAGSSTAWIQNVNGNLPLGLGMVLLTTTLSPLLAPLVLHTVGFVTIDDYSEDLHELASGGVGAFLGTWIIAPAFLGILMRRVIGEHGMAQASQYIKLINFLFLILLNYSNAALALPSVVIQPDLDYLTVILLITLLLSLTSFGAGFLLAQLLQTQFDKTIALMFCFGLKNNGAGLVLASTALAAHPQVLLPIIFYNLIQHFVASLIDHVILRRSASLDTGS